LENEVITLIVEEEFEDIIG